MRKVDDGKKGKKRKKEKEKKREKKRMEFLVATTSLPAVYRPNGYARTTNAGTPHARANSITSPVGKWWVGYWSDETKLMLNSTHIEIMIEVEAELGKHRHDSFFLPNPPLQFDDI